MHPNVLGGIVNGASYLLCVFFAGLGLNQGHAWRLALVSMGLTFFAHVAQVERELCPRSVQWSLTVASWATGLAAGFVLLS